MDMNAIEDRDASQPSPNRRRWAVAMVLCVLALAVTLALSAKVNARSAAFRQIRALGGVVNTFPDLPRWMPASFARVAGDVYGRVQITFLDVPLTQAQLRELSEALDAIGVVDFLALQGSNVTDEWLQELGSPAVEILMLEQTKMTPNGCSVLRQWKRLEIVHLQDNPHVDPKAVRALGLTADVH